MRKQEPGTGDQVAPTAAALSDAKARSSESKFRSEDAVLSAWLREEVGLEEFRRVVRENKTTIVISKFEPDFAPDLFATVDALPELFDDALVTAEYERIAAEHQARGEAPLRTAVWREASESLLERLGDARGIDAHQRMYVLPGIESVQAVLDTILWTGPTIADTWEPHPGEVQAFNEFECDEMDRDLFTRYYGTLDGRRVENYCPGAQFARRLMAQGWRVCTGFRSSFATRRAELSSPPNSAI